MTPLKVLRLACAQYSNYIHGRRKGEPLPLPLDFEIFSKKKGCFLSFVWEKIYFTSSSLPRKTFEKSSSGPLWKKFFDYISFGSA